MQAPGGELALHACVRFDPGAIIASFHVAATSPQPTRHSVQVGPASHALIDPEFLRYTNHSCDPNLVLDTSAMCARAIRPIERGDELTYFYPSTEWAMAEPFRCRCRSPECLGEIAGAAHLPAAVLARYVLAAHVSGLLARREADLRVGDDAARPPVPSGAAGAGGWEARP